MKRKVAGPRRTYISVLRHEQAAATRARILDGFLALGRAGAPDVAIPDLARHVGVSVPTIYRHFPSRRVLLRAVVEHADASVGAPRAAAVDPHDLGPTLRAFFERRARVTAALGPIGDSPLTWTIRREVTVPRRRAFVDGLMEALVPGLSEPRRAWLSDILVVLISATTASAFANYVGCRPDDTAARVQWLIDAVVADARQGVRSSTPLTRGVRPTPATRAARTKTS